MSNETDFNITNYSIEDLLQIFDIKKPLTKEELTQHIDEKIAEYEDDNQEAYANFFSDGLNILLEQHIQMNQILRGMAPQTTAKNFGENIFQNQYYASNDMMNNAAINVPNRQTNTSIVNNNHSTQAPRRLLVPNAYMPSAIQGNMNPIMQNTYQTCVNIDSHYREIRKDTGSTSCTFGVATTKIKMLDSSTDFTINLSEPLTNVIGITVGSIEIPMNAYYPFSEQYGTTTFDVSACGKNHCIDISAGFYPTFSLASTTQMIDISGAINPKLAAVTISDDCSGIKIRIDPNTQKATFFDISQNTPFDVTFFSENNCETDCSSNNCFKDNTGKKIDSNLGWLLGFRQPKYSNISHNGITSESIVNPWGTRYLILEVDDLNRNRNSGNLVSMTDHQTKFKLPSYYNKTRQSYPACPAPCDSSGINFRPAKGDPSGVQITRPCRRGTPANTQLIDGSNNLTTAQKYTITEILNARKTISQDRYFSPVTGNVLYRFSVPRVNMNMLEGTAAPTIINNTQGMANARRYFGPVTLKTLKIRLLNDKGVVLDLNNMDFSFSLIVERLYQY